MAIGVLDKLAHLSEGGWAVQLILVDNASRDKQFGILLDWFVANKKRFEEVLFVAVSRNLGGNRL